MKRDVKIITEKAIELLNDRKSIENELNKKVNTTSTLETEDYKLSIQIEKKIK